MAPVELCSSVGTYFRVAAWKMQLSNVTVLIITLEPCESTALPFDSHLKICRQSESPKFVPDFRAWAHSAQSLHNACLVLKPSWIIQISLSIDFLHFGPYLLSRLRDDMFTLRQTSSNLCSKLQDWCRFDNKYIEHPNLIRFQYCSFDYQRTISEKVGSSLLA